MLKTEVLKMLKRTDGFVSGQAICDELEVSRTAIWKVINQLKAEGYKIEAVQNKGYRLKAVPDILSEEELVRCMNTSWAGSNIYYYQSIDSTNIRAKQLADEGIGNGSLVVADMQEAGKGRRGRGWFSPAGTGVWMSLVLRPKFPPDKASQITLIAALAVASAIKEVSGLAAGIKWPNDIVVNKKKVCGILTEMSVEADYINYVICGIGINVNHESFPQEIKDTATSLAIEKGDKVERAKLIAAVMKHFEGYYAEFEKTHDMSLLINEYNSLLINLGRSVRVLDPKGEWCGKALGIRSDGSLIVQDEAGLVKDVYSGEVSVRGIYGYV